MFKMAEQTLVSFSFQQEKANCSIVFSLWKIAELFKTFVSKAEFSLKTKTDWIWDLWIPVDSIKAFKKAIEILNAELGKSGLNESPVSILNSV